MAVIFLSGILSLYGIKPINQMDGYMDVFTDQPVHAVCSFGLTDMRTYVRTTVDRMDGFMCTTVCWDGWMDIRVYVYMTFTRGWVDVKWISIG